MLLISRFRSTIPCRSNLWHTQWEQTVCLPGGHHLFCLLFYGRLSGHPSWGNVATVIKGSRQGPKGPARRLTRGRNECWLKSRCSLHSHTKEIMTFSEHCVQVDVCVCALLHACMQTASFHASVECRYCRFRSVKLWCDSIHKDWSLKPFHKKS